MNYWRKRKFTFWIHYCIFTLLDSQCNKFQTQFYTVKYIHSTWLVLSNPITTSLSAFVYLSTWFFRHRPWITRPRSRVHLAIWHHLSAFIDIHFLHMVGKKNSYKHFPHGAKGMLAILWPWRFKQKQAICPSNIKHVFLPTLIQFHMQWIHVWAGINAEHYPVIV